MKNFIYAFIFLSLAFCQRTQAQPYQSIFGTDSTQWVFRWINLSMVADAYYYYQKDTLVHDTLYKKVVSNYMASPYTALFREDTASGKVWFRPLEVTDGLDTVEYLTFDFSLSEGDSFDIKNMVTGYSDSPLYSQVDSVRYIDGLKYIYFQHQYAYLADFGPWETPVRASEPFTLIEGIGSNAGPLWKHHFGGLRDQYLMCSYKDGIQTSYKNLRYAGLCPQSGNAINEQDINKAPAIKVYPNPASDYIIIDEAYLGTLKSAGIYDLSGKMLRKITGPGKTDISRIPAGLYLLKITTKDQVTYTQKLVVYR